MAFNESEDVEARLVIDLADAAAQATAEAQIDAFIDNQIQSNKITEDSYSKKEVVIDGSGGANQYQMIAMMYLFPDGNTVIPALWAALISAVNSIDGTRFCEFTFRGRLMAEQPEPPPGE